MIINGGELMVVEWWPFLQLPGPRSPALTDRLERGVVIADLERGDEDELIVAFLHGSAESDGVRNQIADWAELVGFRRVWFPAEVVELDPPSRELDEASVVCVCCGAEFRDGDADFWAMVRRCKGFPATCMVCGVPLPQWSLDRPTGAAETSNCWEAPVAS